MLIRIFLRWVKCSIAFSSVHVLLSRPRIGVRGSEMEYERESTLLPEEARFRVARFTRYLDDKQKSTSRATRVSSRVNCTARAVATHNPSGRKAHADAVKSKRERSELRLYYHSSTSSSRNSRKCTVL
jgi:hypothetical protein